MIMRFFWLIGLLFLIQNGFAQKYTTAHTASGKLKTTFERGMRLSFNGQYEAALQDLEKALAMEPDFIDAQIEWANIKYDRDKYSEAEKGYEKVLAIDPAYDPDVYYKVASAEFKQQKFSEAADHYELFVKSTGKVNERWRESAKKQLDNIRFVAEAMKNPVPFEPKNLGPNINTANSEYLPSLTADGETLIYTVFDKARRDENFYSSKKVNGEWQKGQPITSVNSENNEGAPSISADGKLLVFTICQWRNCDLFFTELKNGKWTPVKNIGAPVNTSGFESQPSLSGDGNILFFASDRRGGYGGKDIWQSRRNTDGSWSEPQNLGTSINTASDEQSPFIHPDGQTLYFMSNGLPGMGGFDLYLSRRQADGQWRKPENIGYPINTEGNEGALFISLDGKTAYFATDKQAIEAGASVTSNPQGGGTTDIYSFELHPAARPQLVTYVKATVSDAQTGKPLAAKVEFIDLATGQVYASSVTGNDGEFLVTLPVGKDYALNVSKEKYLFSSENFALAHSGTLEKPFLLEISLIPIPEGLAGTGDISKAKPVVLKNVFFETGSAALRKESVIELTRLKNLLEENPSLKIQINGHTDNVGSNEDNLVLSKNRAKAVQDFLVENGISAARLKYQGFGESVPVASNDMEEGRQQNRRTEFVIWD